MSQVIFISRVVSIIGFAASVVMHVLGPLLYSLSEPFINGSWIILAIWGIPAQILANADPTLAEHHKKNPFFFAFLLAYLRDFLIFSYEHIPLWGLIATAGLVVYTIVWGVLFAVSNWSGADEFPNMVALRFILTLLAVCYSLAIWFWRTQAVRARATAARNHTSGK